MSMVAFFSHFQELRYISFYMSLKVHIYIRFVISLGTISQLSVLYLVIADVSFDETKASSWLCCNTMYVSAPV